MNTCSVLEPRCPCCVHIHVLCHTDNRSNEWNITTVICLKCTPIFVNFKKYWFFMVSQNHLPRNISDTCGALFRFWKKYYWHSFYYKSTGHLRSTGHVFYLHIQEKKKKQQTNPKHTLIRREHTQGQFHSYLVVNDKPQCVP